MYAQFLNKILTHLIQQHEKEKKNIQNYELKFIPKMQSWFNIPKLINVIHFINTEKKNKKHRIISIDTEEVFDHIHDKKCCHIKALNKLE